MVLVTLVVLTVLLSAWAGFELCKLTHKQRGLDVDDWDIVVPDSPRELIDA